MPGKTLRRKRNQTRRNVPKKMTTVTSHKPTAHLSAPVSRAVQQIVRRSQETKYVANFCEEPNSLTNIMSTYRSFSTAITGTGEIYAAIPRVTVGTTTSSFNRMGDRISLTKAYVNFNITLDGRVNTQAYDRTLHIFLLEAKAVKTLDNYSAIPILNFLDNGDGTTQPFTGQTNTALLPLDTKFFKVLKHYKRRFVKSWGLTDNGSGGSSVTTTSVTSPNPSGCAINVRLPVKLPKVLKYGLDAGAYPINSAPFFCIGWTRNDQLGDIASNNLDILVEARTHMWFKDS